ncbi:MULTISPECIES: ABC transporter permease [unclassified Haloarcula]|uniref:ABC transporter permease n=1 Tax=Haloarcula TaxID=2237 RepID=UPI000EF15B41|nr:MULTISPECIES: ABC transporter permease [unclassified Haloarcula]RLM36472.1 copper ABC transporter permease [Haloarcula sp. Atlit-120R]RLM45145.1 copper ABC transporter permease [Haloarcula sp. Atlit-47R]RLM88712.1 copper ABC transporter permease [Haloarcula sp. Atlit-7R]
MSAEQNPVKRFLGDIDTSIKNSEFADWYPISKKEFRDTVRSPWIWVLSLIFIVLFALPAVLGLYFNIGQQFAEAGASLTTDAYVRFALPIAAPLLPAVAIVIGYAAIARESERGSLKILLSLPYTRGELLAGKFVGRSAITLIPVTVGFLTTLLVLLPSEIEIAWESFLLFALATMTYGVVFTAFAIGLSAALKTARRAMAASLGIYVYLQVFWSNLGAGLGNLLSDHANIDQVTQLHVELFVSLLSPIAAYRTLVKEVLQGSPIRSRLLLTSNPQVTCEEMLGGTLEVTQAGAECANAALPPQYSTVAVIGYLLLWLVAPLVAGYYVFENKDL